MLRQFKAGLSRLRNESRSRHEQHDRWRNTRHLHGPEQVTLSDNEVMVTLLVRDAEWFVGTFLDHHLGLGVKHILVIDNGSTDATADICRSYKQVTLLHNPLPAKLHESKFRTEFSRRIAQGGWIMFADADELVELPVAGENALSRLTTYCNKNGYTAVIGQMLDRFSVDDYKNLRNLDYRRSIAAMSRYSLRDVEIIDYNDRDAVAFSWFLRDNICADPGIGFRRGGLRSELFGENPFLSKHSLVRNRPGAVLMSHPHCASGVSVADVSLLLHHYKLAGDWIARDTRSVAEAHWDHGEDVRRLTHVAAATGGHRLLPKEPRLWSGIGVLQEEGFLYASSTARQAMQM